MGNQWSWSIYAEIAASGVQLSSGCGLDNRNYNLRVWTSSMQSLYPVGVVDQWPSYGTNVHMLL